MGIKEILASAVRRCCAAVAPRFTARLGEALSGDQQERLTRLEERVHDLETQNAEFQEAIQEAYAQSYLRSFEPLAESAMSPAPNGRPRVP